MTTRFCLNNFTHKYYYILILFCVFAACKSNECNTITALGNLGSGINTPFDEFAPCISDSLTLVFSSNKPTGKISGMKNNIEQKNIPSLFYSIFSDGAWEFSTPFALPHNSTYYLQQICFYNCIPKSSDKQNIKQNRFYAVATAVQGSRTNNNCDIVLLDENFNIQSLEFNSNKWEAQATVGNCEQIYFASDRSGGYGGSDIWRVAHTNTGFSEPENLKIINSQSDEVSPFYDEATQRLYFARKEKTKLSVGQFDILYFDFKTQKTVTLPPPYNSDYSDYTPYIYGEKIYLSSNRSGSCGGFDLYAFQKPK